MHAVGADHKVDVSKSSIGLNLRFEPVEKVLTIIQDHPFEQKNHALNILAENVLNEHILRQLFFESQEFLVLLIIQNIPYTYQIRIMLFSIFKFTDIIHRAIFFEFYLIFSWNLLRILLRIQLIYIFCRHIKKVVFIYARSE